MASELLCCPARRRIGGADGHEADRRPAHTRRFESIGSLPGAPLRAAPGRRLAAVPAVGCSGRRDRVARVYGRCLERRRPLPGCVLGTSWERFTR